MKIIADIGASHGGSLKNAYALIAAAKEAGADMVKLQLYDPDWLADSRRAKLGDPNPIRTVRGVGYSAGV